MMDLIYLWRPLEIWIQYVYMGLTSQAVKPIKTPIGLYIGANNTRNQGRLSKIISILGERPLLFVVYIQLDVFNDKLA